MMKFRKENYKFVSNYKSQQKTVTKFMTFALGIAVSFLSAAGVVYFILMSSLMAGGNSVITG